VARNHRTGPIIVQRGDGTVENTITDGYTEEEGGNRRRQPQGRNPVLTGNTFLEGSPKRKAAKKDLKANPQSSD